jgi:hypothetical protein
MTMQVDLDAVIAAIEGLRPTGLTLTKGVGLYATVTIEKVLAEIRAIPTSNARIEAGDAMKVACVEFLKGCEAKATEMGYEGVAGFYRDTVTEIEALDTAAIVGDGV